MEAIRAASLVKPNASGFLCLQTHKKNMSMRKKYMGITARYGDYEPSMVDTNMSVLRRRLYELKLQESSYRPPQEWMEWEKNIRSDYHWTICQATGILYTYLMSTRPTIVLATLSLLLMGVGTSVSVGFLMAWSNIDVFIHNL